jgi:asparagine synthase (glutamine-hydrolysing)
MIRPLAHRGPDDEGVWIDSDAGIGFGHRRLAVMDLSPQGHQPMHSADGRYVLNYNGEIYNHVELRSELDRTGLAPTGGWRGQSDTETLLQAIAAWGAEKAIGKCVGMFAFALWDVREKRLLLVRDRFGEKPLYYGWAGGDFLFASELKAFRAHPRFNNDIDRFALRAFVSRAYVPAPLSIYRRIFKLHPGCILEVSPEVVEAPLDCAPEEGRCEVGMRLTRYWSYTDTVRRGLANPIASEFEALERLEQALCASIRGQSAADVPVGAFLSGGIDSSTIVALYQKLSPVPARSFTIGFEDPAFNEAEHAKAIAKQLGTVHHEQYVRVEQVRDLIPQLPLIYDEPFADSSQIPTFLISRFARAHVTVALSGDGGDELFGGYNRHFAAPQMWSRVRQVPLPIRTALGLGLSRVPSRAWTWFASQWRGQTNPHWGSKMQKAVRVAGSARNFDDVYCSFLDEWALEESPVRDASLVQPKFPLDLGPGVPDAIRVMHSDALTYLPDDILCKVDRASMAVSLECRVPFLDHRVAEVAARIPLRMKICGNIGKFVLRQLLGRNLAPELFERPKSGFAIPVGQWLKGPLRPWAEELLDSDRLALDGWLDAATVHRRWRQHLSGERDSTAAIWTILMFQAWLRAQ